MREFLRRLKRYLARHFRADTTPARAPGKTVQLGTDGVIAISQFAFFSGFVSLQGWVHKPGRVVNSMSLLVGARPEWVITHFALASPGAPAANCGFAATFNTGVPAPEFVDPSLRVIFDDGSEQMFTSLGIPEILGDRGHRLYPEFVERLKTMPKGRLLEIGARARSGISRRDAAPAGWEYLGLDILAGPNVDLVGDAHSMSRILPHASFDAAMSLAVFEHLAMPWKVALELNRVLKPGAIAFIQTHQAFPMHETPWDFWRISADAWPALFNSKTGFRIIESAMAEPLMFVAQRWHPGVNYHDAAGYAVSSVIVEKIAESTLSWDVQLDDFLGNVYPQ